MRYTIILLFFSCALWGQGQNCFLNLFVDRPLLKDDSAAIVANKVLKIKLYEKNFGDSIPKKILLGEWVIEIKNNRIKSTIWKSFTDSTFFKKNYSYTLLGCNPLIKREYKKNKILDIIGTVGDEQLQFTHFVSKYGRIYKTTCETSRWESRYIFDKIEYVYDGVFMIEANYSSPNIAEGYNPFLRLLYEYEK